MRRVARLIGIPGAVVVLVTMAPAAGCFTVQPERGPAILVSGQGPIAERVQAQVGVVDAKLAAVEQLCRGEGDAVEGRCLGPLDELKRKKAFYRQRAHALLKTADTRSDEDVAEWQELEIEVEMLTSEVDAFANEVKYEG